MLMYKIVLFISSLLVFCSLSAQEILVIDLRVQNEIKIIATNANAASTASGSDETGFYLQGFFSSPTVLAEQLMNSNFSSANESPSGAEEFFTIDAGLNIWGYAAGSTSSFTAGQRAFTGESRWQVDADSYNKALNGSLTGNVYFPADDASYVAAGAPLIGTYRKELPVMNLAPEELIEFAFYPQPTRDKLNLSASERMQKVQILGLSGRILQEVHLEDYQASLAINNLTKGRYLLKVTFESNLEKTALFIKE